MWEEDDPDVVFLQLLNTSSVNVQSILGMSEKLRP